MNNSINSIIDISHHNTVDMAKIKKSGIIAVIHKATEGSTYQDKRYTERKKAALDNGLLWGAYHFATGAPVLDQVEHFLDYAKPADNELISLDWEPAKSTTITLAQVHDFVQIIHKETNRWPVIYGGHLLRTTMAHKTDAILAKCPLWYARYADSPIGIPKNVWPSYTLWQYTDGNAGTAGPHHTDGAGDVDRNIFNGTEEELRQQWPFGK